MFFLRPAALRAESIYRVGHILFTIHSSACRCFVPIVRFAEGRGMLDMGTVTGEEFWCRETVVGLKHAISSF